MIEVSKKEKETNESLIRRFSRLVKQSDFLNDVRRVRYNRKDKSKQEKREEAIYKVKMRKEIDKLKKLGKFDDDNVKNIKKKIAKS